MLPRPSRIAASLVILCLAVDPLLAVPRALTTPATGPAAKAFFAGQAINVPSGEVGDGPARVRNDRLASEAFREAESLGILPLDEIARVLAAIKDGFKGIPTREQLIDLQSALAAGHMSGAVVRAILGDGKANWIRTGKAGEVSSALQRLQPDLDIKVVRRKPFGEPNVSAHGHAEAEPAATAQTPREAVPDQVAYWTEQGAPPSDPLAYFARIHEHLQAALQMMPNLPGLNLPRNIAFRPEFLSSTLADPWTFVVEVSHPTSTGGAEYGDGVGELWEEVFQDLADRRAGARVLDIGTGRFPLLLAAQRIARRHGVSFDLQGLDRAYVPPEEIPAGIRFHRGLMEAMPIPSGSVDLAVSMHGFGYGQLETSIAELARVLAPHGRAVFVIHRPDSELVKGVRQVLEEAQLLDTLPLFGPGLAALRRQGPVPFQRAIAPALEELEILKNTRSAAGLSIGTLQLTEIQLAVVAGLARTGVRDAAWYCLNFIYLCHVAMTSAIGPALLETSASFAPEKMDEFEHQVNQAGLYFERRPAPVDDANGLVGWEIRLTKVRRGTPAVETSASMDVLVDTVRAELLRALGPVARRLIDTDLVSAWIEAGAQGADRFLGAVFEFTRHRSYSDAMVLSEEEFRRIVYPLFESRGLLRRVDSGA